MPASLPSVRLWPQRALVAAVRWYQRTVSPLSPPSCRFTPTCSQYAVEAVSRYGALRGSLLALWRIARCAPWGGHGYDPPRWFGENPDHRCGEATADHVNPADRADGTEPSAPG